MDKSQFYKILESQIKVLEDLEELEFQLYRDHDTFNQSKIDLVSEAKEKLKKFADYLELREKQLFPEED